MAGICLWGGVASAQRETVTVTTKDGDQGTFEILIDDPNEAPNLYIGPLCFVDVNLGKTRGLQPGLGADMQYTFNHRLGVHFRYLKALSGPSGAPELGSLRFSEMDGGLDFFFSSHEEKTEAMIKIKSETEGNTTTIHVFNMPCKVQEMMGIKAGFNSYEFPANYYVSGFTNNDYPELTLASTRALVFSAGIKKTTVYMLELDSKEFGNRFYQPRQSWYGEALFSPSPEAIFFYRPDENGVRAETMKEAVGYQHSYKVIKAGIRLGYERTSVFWKSSNIGTNYRFEIGYRPGIKGFGGGFFLQAHYGLNFGIKAG